MQNKLNVHTSSKSAEWETPPAFFKIYNDIYHFDIDVCATHENALCSKYWTIEDNALKKDWIGKCWMNPPYGRGIGLFMKKAYKESLKEAFIMCLIPARTDTRWWHDYAMKGKITFIKGRLKFINSAFPNCRKDNNHKLNSAPFPSAIVIFEKEKND